MATINVSFWNLLKTPGCGPQFETQYGATDAGLKNFLADLQNLIEGVGELAVGGGESVIGDCLNCQQNCYINFNKCMEKAEGSGWGTMLCWNALEICLHLY